tara:strand:+ start:662 stop:1369 length:708 start_codon:yes stop_codon:yes gene_type:complete
LVSTVIKNWDNKTWLSSSDYIKSFNKFLLKQIKLNFNSRIIDIGCGRGRILGALSSKLRLIRKPLGIDIINHKDKDKRINFKRISALTFLRNNKNKFDLILIKQTIHLLNLKDIKKLLSLSMKNLNKNGKILIFTLDPIKNELPTFKLMKIELIKSLQRDKKILKQIKKLYPHKTSKFVYKVNIDKNKYLDMVQKRYISTLLSFNEKELKNGIKQINSKYRNRIKFFDKLICLSL